MDDEVEYRIELNEALFKRLDKHNMKQRVSIYLTIGLCGLWSINLIAWSIVDQGSVFDLPPVLHALVLLCFAIFLLEQVNKARQTIALYVFLMGHYRKLHRVWQDGVNGRMTHNRLVSAQEHLEADYHMIDAILKRRSTKITIRPTTKDS